MILSPHIISPVPQSWHHHLSLCTGSIQGLPRLKNHVIFVGWLQNTIIHIVLLEFIVHSSQCSILPSNAATTLNKDACKRKCIQSVFFFSGLILKLITCCIKTKSNPWLHTGSSFLHAGICPVGAPNRHQSILF